MSNRKSKPVTSQMLDRLALLKLVKTSSFLQPREKDVWGALYTLGPSTGQEIDQHIGAIGCASSRLIILERRQMTVRIGRRRCSVSGKTAALWNITSVPPTIIEKPPKKISFSPTTNDLKTFVRLMNIALLDANRRGMRVTADTRRVLKWLDEGAPCVHAKIQNQPMAGNKKSSKT